MSKPPPSGPHSDIDGVNRDARVGTPTNNPHPEPGSSLRDSKEQGKGRPVPGGDR